MADLSKITLPSGSIYNLVDALAREDIATIKSLITSGMHFLGETTTELEDGSITNPIIIGEQEITATAGSIVLQGESEYIFSDTDNKWHLFGDAGSFRALAFKDSASGDYTPTGSVNANFTGTEGDISAAYTPSGSVSTPTITVTPSTRKINQITSVGTMPSCTLPTLAFTVANENLTITWGEGSYSAGEAPGSEEVELLDGISSATSTQPEFTGTPSTATGKFTPSGNVEAGFVGNNATITVS